MDCFRFVVWRSLEKGRHRSVVDKPVKTWSQQPRPDASGSGQCFNFSMYPFIVEKWPLVSKVLADLEETLSLQAKQQLLS